MDDARQPFIRVVEVGLETRTSGQASVFTYLAPEDAAVGNAYAVPLGKRVVLGYALSVKLLTEEELGFPLKDLKPVVAEAPEFDLPTTSIELAKYIAKQQSSSLGSALQMVTPPRTAAMLRFGFRTKAALDSNASTVAQEVWKTIDDAGVLFIGKSTPKPLLDTIERLAADGYLT